MCSQNDERSATEAKMTVNGRWSPLNTINSVRAASLFLSAADDPPALCAST